MFEMLLLMYVYGQLFIGMFITAEHKLDILLCFFYNLSKFIDWST